MQKGRIRQPTHSQQTHCKIFNNCARGSDSNMGWNAAECKYALEALLAGVSTKRATEQHRHLNRSKTQEIRCNTLRNFPLQGLNKHIHRFRCSGKEEHLNLATRQNPTPNSLTTNALQDFQQLNSRFRSLAGLEHRRMQMRLGGTSGRGIHQTRNRTAQASEPEQNSKNPLQHIERLSVSQFQQARPLVQMRQKRGASEPCRKAESAANPLATNALQDLQQLHPWFRSLAGLEHHRLQIHSGGASGRGSHQTRNRTAQASEPRQNPRNSPQHIEKLSIARIKQASLLVQMQWERDASEPEQNSKNPLQHIEKLPIARFQQAHSQVQMQR